MKKITLFTLPPVLLLLFFLAFPANAATTCVEDNDPSSIPNPLNACSITDLITKVADFIVDLALVFAFIMIILSGFRFATAGGDEKKLGDAKRNFTWTVVGIAIILASKALVVYLQEILGVRDTTTTMLQQMIDRLTGTMNSIIVLLFALVTIYFIWGVIEYIKAAGDEDKITQGKRHMVWGLVGMAIMSAAWGIVEIIRDYIIKP